MAETSGNEYIPLNRPTNSRRWPWRSILIILTIVTGLLLLVTVVRYLFLSNQIQSEAFANASQQATAAAEQLELDFENTAQLASQVAEDLSSGRLLKQDIAPHLQEILLQNPDLDGITVAYDRGAYGDGTDLFFVYVARDPIEGFIIQEQESLYDYTLPPSADPGDPQTAWFYVPFTEGPAWTEPFLAAGAGRVLIEYGVPFTAEEDGTGQPIGVVAFDYSLDGMRELVAALDLGLTGFGAVYSDSGTFLSHPVPERVAKGNIFTDETLQEENFQDAARRAAAGETVSIQRTVNDDRVWNYFAPIAETGWTLVVQLSEVEFILGREELLRSQVAIVLAAGTFLFFLLSIILHFDEATRDRLWLASITFSAIGLAMIIIIIVLERNTPMNLTDGVLLTSQTAVNRYEEALQQKYAELGLSPPVAIPTGVLIQSARFPEPSVVTLNGYLWQRVPVVEEGDIQPGISFPQLIDEPMTIQDIYVEEREQETLVISEMTVALRQVFDPIQYPFDRYDVNVRLAPKEFANNALLVPDLEAYNVTAPSQLPGLDDTVRINSWEVIASAFGLSFRRFGTDLGLTQRPTIEVPELAFNIRVERRFLGPFIAFFLPALVATIMIFGYLLNDIKPDEPEEIVTALSYTAALFFVVAVLHSALRDNAAAIGLTYLEYFYLMLYVLSLFVALNSFLVVKFPYLPLVSIGNNLIAKLLFWPAVVSFMLLVTLYVFVLSR